MLGRTDNKGKGKETQTGSSTSVDDKYPWSKITETVELTATVLDHGVNPKVRLHRVRNSGSKLFNDEQGFDVEMEHEWNDVHLDLERSFELKDGSLVSHVIVHLPEKDSRGDNGTERVKMTMHAGPSDTKGEQQHQRRIVRTVDLTSTLRDVMDSAAKLNLRGFEVNVLIKDTGKASRGRILAARRAKIRPQDLRLRLPVPLSTDRGWVTDLKLGPLSNNVSTPKARGISEVITGTWMATYLLGPKVPSVSLADVSHRSKDKLGTGPAFVASSGSPSRSLASDDDNQTTPLLPKQATRQGCANHVHQVPSNQALTCNQ